MTQSSLVLFPLANESGLLSFPLGVGSGSSLVELTLLTTPWVQASDIPVDSVPIGTSESFDPVTGFLTATYNSDTAANRAGFQNGHIYLTKKVSDALPGFDPSIHELLAYIDKGDTDDGTGEKLCSLCIIDESTPTVTSQGVGGGWTESSASTSGVSVVQPTAASVSNEASSPCRGAYLRWDFNDAGADWAVNFTIRGDATGITAPAPNPVNNNKVRVSPEECYFMLSLGKRLTDNLNGQVGMVRAMVGYRLRTARPELPTPPREPKPSGTDEEVIYIVGDSFGTQGESLGIDAGDTVDKNGVTQTGPATVLLASVLKGFVEQTKILRPGCTISCWNHSVATISLETVLSSHWALARNRGLAASKPPTVVITLCGTNSSAAGQSAPVPGHFDAFVTRVQARFPTARILALGPFVDENNAAPGGLPAQARPEAGIVREAIRARCDGVTVHFFDARDYTGDPDEIHLLNTSYTEVGVDMANRYYNGG